MKWEYRMIRAEAHGFRGGDFEADTVLETMNAFGEDGWELVTGFDTNMMHGRSRDVVLIFKRPAGGRRDRDDD